MSRRARATALLAITAAAGVIAATAVFQGRHHESPSTAVGTASVVSPQTAGSSTPAGAPADGVPRPGAEYVHMGDSYAAGTGPYDLDPTAPVNCQRTLKNPGRQLALRMGWQIRDVSCASAKTENLTVEQYFGAGPQLDALGTATRIVTVVLGANDEDFFDTLVTRCAALGSSAPTGSPCQDTLGADLEAALVEGTRPNLRKAFTDIAAKAPNARIYALGYPWVVPDSGACRPAMRFADGDIPFARTMQALLNKQVKAAAEHAGAVFVDMSRKSDGHDACAAADERWIEPAFDVETGRPTGLPANHPNPRGQRAMADALRAALAR